MTAYEDGIGMEVSGASAVVTGAAGGIGAALADRLLDRGATHVVLSDLDSDRLTATSEDLASSYGPERVAWVVANATTDEGIARMLAATATGTPDLFFANAGIFRGFGLQTSDTDWEAIVDVNVMGPVRAARLLVPRWLENGGGCFAVTASAAGLLTQLGSPTYATTKHAAIGFAEWLAASYGDRGVQVAALCPMGVRTPMVEGADEAQGDAAVAHDSVAAAADMLDPEEVADSLLNAIEAGRFLALPHPQVADMYADKAADPDRWLSGMQRYRRSLSK